MLGALRLAVLLLLAYAAGGSLAVTGRVVPGVIADRAVEYPPALLYPLGTSIAALAIVAVARGWYALGLLATLGALAAALVVQYLTIVGTGGVAGELYYPAIDTALDFALTDLTFWPLPLALLLSVPLTRWRTAGTRRPLAWLLAVPVAAVLLPTDYDVTLGVQPWATLGVMIGFLLWAAVDARATVAAGVLLLSLITAWLAIYDARGWWQPDTLGVGWFWTFVIGAATLLAAGTFALRRQADV